VAGGKASDRAERDNPVLKAAVRSVTIDVDLEH
jgi:hypothetical protein